MNSEASEGVQRIVILGSTGSIGLSALDIIAHHPGELEVVGLAARRNVDRLEEQARAFRPRYVAIQEEAQATTLRQRLRDLPVQVWGGSEGVERIAQIEEADLVLSAIEGTAGLLPTLAAIRAGRDVALANKEPLVAAGNLILEAARGRVRIIPVDSEHSAIFQALEGHRHSQIKRILLTASGGPFRGRTREELERVTSEEALRHPVWDMGPKVTIDSATLMNKGLEVIEAHWLFGVPAEAIEILVHPQSIVHSLVEFVDQTMLAQLGLPDMRAPISYALCYPKRIPAHYPALDLTAVGQLTFYQPDHACFPCLSLAREALRAGETVPAVLNAANEVAVSSFLRGEIRFTQIPELIEEVISAHRPEAATDLEVILSADRWARAEAGALVDSWNGAPSG